MDGLPHLNRPSYLFPTAGRSSVYLGSTDPNSQFKQSKLTNLGKLFLVKLAARWLAHSYPKHRELRQGTWSAANEWIFNLTAGEFNSCKWLFVFTKFVGDICVDWTFRRYSLQMFESSVLNIQAASKHLGCKVDWNPPFKQILSFDFWSSWA